MVQYLYCMTDNKMWSPHLVDDNQPLYIQLVEAMALAIMQGELKAGDKLPPQRQLAWQLNINPSTVTKAFQLATQKHLITGEVGRGTYVLAQSSEAKLYNIKQAENDNNIDLSTHVAAKVLPDNDLKETLQLLISDEGSFNEFNQYLSPHQLAKIQLSAQKWLQQLHYSIESQHCIPTTTAQNALLVTLLNCTQTNDTVLVDELTFPGMKTVAKQLDLKLVGIKMDEQGMRPDALDLAIRSTGAKVLVSDPTWQNPTASSMSEARQKQITSLITSHNLLFIEEFVVGALSGCPPISHAIQQHAILITSFAKAVNPGIRFSVIAGLHPVVERLKTQAHATSWQLCPLTAEIACQWIAAGKTERRLTKQQQIIRQRFKLFKQVFPSQQYSGNTSITSHIWLATNQNSELVEAKLKTLGVDVVASKHFAVSHQFPHYIRVSLTAAKSIQQLSIALKLIKSANVIKQTL